MKTHHAGQHIQRLADCPACGTQIGVPTGLFFCDGCGAELACELQIIRSAREVESDRLKERIFGERWMTIIR
jgi:hypothetical protein